MNLRAIQRIGIMGGGINAALLCLEARKKGIETTIVDSNIHCPASRIADEHLVSSLNRQILEKLIYRTDFIVFTEKLKNTNDYKVLAEEKADVYPDVESLIILSSRRDFFAKMEEIEIPTSRYKILEKEEDVLEFLEDTELPVSIREYYKNSTKRRQWDETLIMSDEDIVDLRLEDKEIDYWLAEEMPLDSLELSVGVTRDIKNKMYHYSVCEDTYIGDNWVQSHVPARTTKTLRKEAIALARRTIRRLNVNGTFTVNIVATRDKKLYVSDVKPYALDNSVYTNEGCSVSQSDHLIRTILGLPLYKSNFQGVVFLHLEKNVDPKSIGSMGRMLNKAGSNMYSFNGNTHNNRKLLYTFKANSWEDLEETLNK